MPQKDIARTQHSEKEEMFASFLTDQELFPPKEE
jgi:hypothetical protein